MPAEPLTARQVIDAMQHLIDRHPEYADRPVHIMDMEDESDTESEYDNLTTHVEEDSFDVGVPLMICLSSWRSFPEWKSGLPK